MTPEAKNPSEKFWRTLVTIVAWAPITMIVLILVAVLFQGAQRLGLTFLSGYPARKPEQSGLLPAIAGSAGLLLLTACMAVPLGIGAALYVEEFRPSERLLKLFNTVLDQLATLPPVLYGLVGLELYIRWANLEPSLFVGAATLALMATPMIIRDTRQALQNVPDEIRQAAWALGGSCWRNSFYVVLPAAKIDLLVAFSRTMARLLGETAPLLLISTLTYVTFVPDGPNSPFSAVPIQIFDWLSRPQQSFHSNAAGAIAVLLAAMGIIHFAAFIMQARQKDRKHS